MSLVGHKAKNSGIFTQEIIFFCMKIPKLFGLGEHPCASILYLAKKLHKDWRLSLITPKNFGRPSRLLFIVLLLLISSITPTGNFTCLEVIFKFKRRLGYYLFHTYIPTCLIVMMSWISFWIKPEAVPARVTLGVTSLLTLSTQHANSQKSLPPVSYIKVRQIFQYKHYYYP